MNEIEIRESIAGHALRNAELLKDLRRGGTDTERPCSVEHHFWASNQSSGVALAKRLYDLGYVILVLSPTDDADGTKVWNVEAGIQRTLADAASESVSEELVRVAAQFDAVYDGWGASV